MQSINFMKACVGSRRDTVLEGPVVSAMVRLPWSSTTAAGVQVAKSITRGQEEGSENLVQRSRRGDSVMTIVVVVVVEKDGP